MELKSWAQIIELVLEQANHDRKVFRENLGMSDAVRGIGRGIQDATNVMEKIDLNLPRIQALNRAKDQINARLFLYLNMPGSEGEWECSVLEQVMEKLEDMAREETDRVLGESMLTAWINSVNH